MTAEFHIRPATPRDTSSVDALLAESYPRLLKPDYPPSVLVTAIPIISRARPELMRCGTYFVAEAPDGRLLGAGGWTAGDPARGARSTGRGHIRHFVTDHRHTRQGIAAGVMAHVVETARAAGIGQLDCLATRSAVPFYRAVGFVEIAPREVPLAPGVLFPVIAMVLAISR